MGTKLGLKIVRASMGLGSGFERNTEQSWTKYVRDTREDYKCIPTLEEDSDASALLYSAIETGEFFTLISGIAGRPGDFVSAWIFVPSSIEISGKELESVINDTRVQILRDEINTETLTTIFDKDYPHLDLSKTCTRTDGNKLAVRYFGRGTDYSLREVLNLLSQPENTSFKGIFLIDNSSSIKAIGCEDISNHKLKDSFIIEAPKPDNGFIPYLNNNEFITNIRATEGERIIITWKKNGYSPIQEEIIVKENSHQSKGISPIDIKKLIPFTNIEVCDEKGRPISEDYSLYIERQLVTKGQALPIRQAALQQVHVEVKNLSGYKNCSADLDFSKSDHQKIYLKENCFTYFFELPIKRDESSFMEVKPVEINSKRRITRTPFPGYHSYDGEFYENSTIPLYYRAEKKPIWKRLIPLAVFLLFGMCLGFGIASYIYDEQNKKAEAKLTVAQNSAKQTAKEEEKPKKEAITLLERSEWIKTDFDNVTELKGLWDELNEYKFDKVLNRGGDLDKSGNFSVLKQVIRDFKEAGGKSEMFIGHNCPDGDSTITYSLYKASIERKTTDLKKKSQSNSAAHNQSVNTGKKQNANPKSSSSKNEEKNDDYSI